MLKAENIYKSFGSLPILKGVSLEVNKSEIVSIVGASGAGKSTFLHIIGTLDKPDSGEIQLNDIDLLHQPAKKISEIRNKKIGFIFQFHHLLPEFNTLENVCIPAFIAGISRQTAEIKAKKILETLGLSHRLQHKPNELSGGEQQRAAVARALINDPDIILADEPSGNLDSHHAKDLHQLFFSLRQEFAQTFIVVTHNEEFADMADRKLLMKDGMIVNG